MIFRASLLRPVNRLVNTAPLRALGAVLCAGSGVRDRARPAAATQRNLAPGPRGVRSAEDR